MNRTHRAPKISSECHRFHARVGQITRRRLIFGTSKRTNPESRAGGAAAFNIGIVDRTGFFFFYRF